MNTAAEGKAKSALGVVVQLMGPVAFCCSTFSGRHSALSIPHPAGLIAGGVMTATGAALIRWCLLRITGAKATGRGRRWELPVAMLPVVWCFFLGMVCRASVSVASPLQEIGWVIVLTSLAGLWVISAMIPVFLLRLCRQEGT